MQIREVVVQNFRGLRSFDWRPQSRLTCIIGPGDSCKSTILDAIDAALGTRWLGFTDVDFTDGDTTKSIEICVTVGALPREALREGRMGLHLRGWREDRGLRDEPEDDDEPVVTVRLSIDSSLEPVWELITDRQEPRTLSTRDRALFGVVRLGGDIDRHLTWGQGSSLARLNPDRAAAAPLLADAYRRARDLLKQGTLPALDAVAARVHQEAKQLGAYAGEAYSAGLDTQRSSMSLGALAIHGDGVPLRLTGLGTRRLVALAVQQMSIPEGAIVLVDELEHGLEPHRIRHAMKLLRDAVEAQPSSLSLGQIFLTSHSSVSVVELSCTQLAVCRSTEDGAVLRTPSQSLQALTRRVPEALLSRGIVVCEGKTEVGLLRGLRDVWAARHANEPLAARGVVFADGGGTQAVETACDLAALGYETALLRDSDVTLTARQSRRLREAGIARFEWDENLATEQRVLLDVSPKAVQEILSVAIAIFTRAAVLDAVQEALGTKQKITGDYGSWVVPGKAEIDFRRAIGTASKDSGWFKQIEPGQRLGAIVASDLATIGTTSLARTLDAVEAWAYGR